MNTRKQFLISALLVGTALGSVGLYSALASPDEEAGGMAGHDMAAMAPGGGEEAGPVTLTAEAARRIGVAYATASLKPFRSTVHTVGSISYDETRITSVNTKIEGWIERLYLNITGAPVTRGQPLLEVYSPMLVAAQEELLLASRMEQEARSSGSARSLASAEQMLEAARRRLRYWDITVEEIARIESTGTPQKTLTLRSPASGFVVEKSVVDGSRITPGMELFRIADLSRVWIEGEVFEKDLSLVRTGQPATVTLEAYPGERFDAVVNYVYPEVSLDSRTARIRLELANPGLRVMPGMYAQVELATGGDRMALLVPRSAVHFTGTRSLVFARHGDRLMPHEVTTGLISGNEIEILAGLEPGMEVVSSANFLVDAESNMGAALSSVPRLDPDPLSAGGAHLGH